MNTATRLILSLSAVALTQALVHADPVFAPGDFTLGGMSDGTNFNIGIAGTAAGVNNWPAAESPDHVIDGVGQKYLNFAKLNTGFIVTPSLGGADNTVVTSMTIWTSNDALERDPASFELYGTNVAVDTGATSFALSNFSLIASGPLTLPDLRQPGGAAALDPAASQTVFFLNSGDFDSYLVVFPTVKNETTANSMQVGEVQLTGTVVPEPSTLGLLGLATAGICAWRRRR